MSCKIYNSTYKDQNSLTLESMELKVQFLPELGGKMASFIHKKTGREFLVQCRNVNYKVLEYDCDYVNAECSGFDDMFPTIDPVYYPNFPWAGVRIPDHGEVCGLKWEYEVFDSCLRMWVYGVRMPYRFEKEIRFESDNKLNIEYTVTNLSEFDMDFIWAAHSMINTEENGEIIVPPFDNKDVTCVFSYDKEFGAYGDKLCWPVTLRKDGKEQKLNVTTKKNETGNNYKIYFDKEMSEGWCAYKYAESDLLLTLSFPTAKVPYLGIWVNEGSFHGLHNVALEPCTGSYDRIDYAKVHHQNSVLYAKGDYKWFLNYDVKYLE